MTTFRRAQQPVTPPPGLVTFRRASLEFRFFGRDVPRDENGRWTSGTGGRWHAGYDPLAEIPASIVAVEKPTGPDQKRRRIGGPHTVPGPIPVS